MVTVRTLPPSKEHTPQAYYRRLDISTTTPEAAYKRHYAYMPKINAHVEEIAHAHVEEIAHAHVEEIAHENAANIASLRRFRNIQAAVNAAKNSAAGSKRAFAAAGSKHAFAAF